MRAQLLAISPTPTRPVGAQLIGALRTVALAVLLLAAAPMAHGDLPVFKFYVEAPGPYRVSFEDLVAEGLQNEGLPSADLGVTNEGHAVPIWVEDGGDGVFGPGDWLEFVGDLSHGWVSHLNEHTRYNAYFLRFDATNPVRMTAHRPAPIPPSEQDAHHTLRRRRHHERDFLLQSKLPSLNDRPSELWYWAKLTHLAEEPFTHGLHLSDLRLAGADTVQLRIELRGWSQPKDKPDGVMDHQVDVLLNGEELASATWDGTESYQLTIADVPTERFVQGENALTLKVAKRAAAASDDWLIDVIMLNWIEIDYPRIVQIGGGWTDFELSAPQASKPMLLRTLAGVEFVLYGLNGSRMTSDALPHKPLGDFVDRTFQGAPGESSFVAVSPDHIEAPQAIVLERPSRLTDTSTRADYIMIAHRRLLEAIEPLAEFHRSQGLDVEVVDLQDIYDEFAGGVARPWALRDFLSHAYHRWSRPAPRFVLLVGDASWNGKDVYVGDGSFPDNVERAAAAPVQNLEETNVGEYTPYDEDTDLINRQLVPTWNQSTPFGHSASDNYFVAVDGDDAFPDMAIGRFPVVEPSDVTAIVDKTIRYGSKPEVGPWRRSVVFLTNTLLRFHKQSKYVASVFTAEGFSPEEIYPRIEEADNAQYTQRLVELLNEGQLFIHYLGHGGRYIWETGRRDLKENRDLFTFEDLETLNPTGRLPIVLSLTCYSAPFDHPEADSLGERLLRIPERGAIAVIAASSTNGPSGAWGQILLEELTRPGATVGEAFMRAKHRNSDFMFVNMYNLLGDPAAPVALPAAELTLSVSKGKRNKLTVNGALDNKEFSGEVLIELVDENREILHSVTSRLARSKFAADFEISAEELAAVHVARAYAWDVSRSIDAAGVVELAPSATLNRPKRPRPPRRLKQVPVVEPPPPPPEATAEEIRADVVAWWSFNATGGVAIRDHLGAHPGSLIGRADRTNSPRGDALAFYGHGYADFGSDQLDVGTGDFTIHAWISTRQARDKVWVILDKRTHIGYHLYNHQGRLGLQLADEQFSNYKGPFIADGRWHHIAVTVDRDLPDGIRWFVDGTEVGIREDPTPHQGSLDNPSPLVVAGRHSGGGNFVGSLYEMGIFRRALSVLDIEKLYKGGWDWLAEAETAP